MESNENEVYLDIRVSPDSSETKITRVDPWRNQLKISIKEEAKRGEANKALVKFFAGILNISRKKINITRGKSSKSKRMHFKGVDGNLLADKIGKIVGGYR